MSAVALPGTVRHAGAAQERPIHTRTDASRSVRIELYGLLPLEKEYLETIIAVMRDRQLALVRRQLVAGEVVPVIEDGVVTWIDVDQLGEELLHRLREVSRS